MEYKDRSNAALTPNFLVPPAVYVLGNVEPDGLLGVVESGRDLGGALVRV
jgi:hypothetical protein